MSMAAEIRPPVFSGKPDEDVLAWSRRFDTVARALEWDVTRKVTQMPLYLGGFAAIWWDKFTARGTQLPVDYKAASDALKNQFLPADYKRQIRAKIRQRRLQQEE